MFQTSVSLERMKVYTLTVSYTDLQANLDAFLQAHPDAEIVQALQNTTDISNRIFVTVTIFYREP